MQRILIFILLINSIIFSQKRGTENLPFIYDAFFEVHQLNIDSLNTYFSCKIPFDKAYFVKSDDVYLSNVKINLEIRDSSKNVINRQTVSVSAKTETFDETNSKNKFLEAIISLNLAKGKYQFLPTIEFANSSRVSNYPGITFLIDDHKLFYEPFSVSQIENIGSNNIVVNNFGSNIPFSNNSLSLFFPISESANFPITVLLKQNDKIVFENDYNKESGKYSPILINNKLTLRKDDSGINFIEVNQFNSKLNEGNVSIEISNSQSSKVFEKKIEWFNKPFSLNNLEDALKLLNIIDKEDVVDNILDQDEDKYQKLLFNYWRKFDPDTTTLFNEVMEEFYQRVDEADRSYSIFDKKKGSLTDRGKIFIKYGKPDQINRNFKQIDSTKEIWKYTSLNLQFIFIDNSGTGNFVLHN